MPRPSQLGQGASLPLNSNRKTIIACPECGLVSAYWERDVKEFEAPRSGLFQSGECRLVSTSAECEDTNCHAPKVVHTVIGTGWGSWKEKVAPKDWKFLSDARCGNDHQLLGTWKHSEHITWAVSELWR
jgi:hypothetical protein